MRACASSRERWGVVTFAVGVGPGAEADGDVCSIRFRVLDNALLRLRGLLGTRRGDGRALPCLLVGCASVHTLGMAYAIDVAFVSGEGRVLKVARDVPAGRLVSCAGAAHALERPSSGEPWPRAGQLVDLQLLDVV